MSLPAALVASSPVFTTVQQEYSNTAAVTVDSNSFVINSNTISFVFPAAATPTTTADFEVFVGGVYQNPDAFTFPSTVYGSQGIDIADNTATKLLLNLLQTSLMILIHHTPQLLGTALPHTLEAH